MWFNGCGGAQVLNKTRSELTESPEDGCYIDGLFIEGAAFDVDKMEIAESKPKELFTDMPAIWLVPVANRVPPTSGVYDCPVYKTLTRAGDWVIFTKQSKIL